MDADSIDRRFEKYLADRANQPFGDHEALSGQVLRPFSDAGHDAAHNLLHKVRDALDAGDEERAVTFADRAARVPFDRHEETLPAANEAHMALFNAVVDELEDSGEDDSVWLDAALAVLDSAEPDGASCLRDVLLIVASEHGPTAAEQRRIRGVVGDGEPREGLRDLRVEPAELSRVVLSVMRTVNAYEQAVDARYG